jgi:tripartite-type tricarboxylate transporter receptor subunit TctC
MFGMVAAQSNHTINFINIGAPGGSADVFMDIYEPCLASNNISVIKTFKGGADGLIGIQHLMNMTDTESVTHVLTGGAGMLQTNKYPNIDTEKLLQPVVWTGKMELVMLSKPGRINSIDELKQLSKTRQVNVGVGGGILPYIAKEWLDALNINYVLVPYKVSTQSYIDAVSGELDLAFSLYLDSAGMVSSNRLQILTSSMNNTMAKKYNHESIYKYVKTDSKLLPIGTLFTVRSGTKQKTINMLYDTVTKCSRDNNVLDKLAARDTVPIIMTTADTEKKIYEYHRANK